MKFLNVIKANLVIFYTALHKKKSFYEVRQAMQQALDQAWNITWTPGNILAQAKWQQLFGSNKPALEEFITKLATVVKSQTHLQN